MDLSTFHPSRRELIRILLMGTCVSSAALAILNAASAKAAEPIVQGFQKVVGDVRLNKAPVQVGQVVRPGDICSTGAGSECIIIIGEHAFLLREHSEVEFEIEHFEQGHNTTITERIKILAGAVMSVFGKTQASISTPLATIGIRGTGIYIEVMKEKNYVCLCYGQAEIQSTLNAAVTKKLNTFHHEEPQNLYANPNAHNGLFIEPEKMINHMDEELIMLEALVGRIPLFGPEPIQMPAGK
ncbi:MAG: hypothetical protein OQK24_03930 [Magnetovibrio sp.]|nr:hypothetical protein [Magnetovibrio sp.]